MFSVLCKHKNIKPSRVKEPQFLALPRSVIIENIQWYNSLFDKTREAMLLDGSTFYFQSERAWQNIYRYFEDPRIIIMIRDPVKRAYSSYSHMVKQVPACERRSFTTIVSTLTNRIANDTPLSDVENQMVKKAVDRGTINEEYIDGDYLRDKYDVSFNSNFVDTLWPYRYFTISQYHDKVEGIKKLFGPSRVKVVVFERLVQQPSHATREVFNFLELSTPNRLDLPHKNPTNIPTGKLARALMWIRRNNSIGKKIWKHVKSKAGPLAKFAWRAVRKRKPSLPKSTYNRARSIISHEYKYWMQKYDYIDKVWSKVN